MSEPLLDCVFVRAEIASVRHQVDGHVTALGLTGHRRHGFVLAVNEVVTNVVRYAGGAGRVTLDVVDGALRCVVADNGPGIPEHRLDADGPPAAFAVGGRGIWLAYQLCDVVDIRTGPAGTSIELRSALLTPGKTGDLGGSGGAAGVNGHESPGRRTALS